MRCQNCKFENREGVNFCEECGEKLTKPLPGLCPVCGFQNREGVNFCEECGAKLMAEIPTQPKKKLKRKKAQPTSQAAVEVTPSPEAVVQTPPQTVVVQVQQEKKRRLNPLWLVFLLLLLLISCACLLMYEVVVPPVGVSAAIDPVLEAVRVRIPPGVDRAIGGIAEGLGAQPGGGVIKEGNNAGGVNQPGGAAPTGDQVCDQLIDHFNAGELIGFVQCAEDEEGVEGIIDRIPDDECEIDVDMWDIMDDDLDQLPMDEIREDGFEVRYRWKNGRSGVVELDETCTVLNWCARVPRDPDSDRIDFTILYQGCEIGKGYSDGRLVEEAPPPAEPECCSDTRFVNIQYDAGFLYFDILCNSGQFADQVVTGTVYDGAGNFWTDMECTAENNDSFSFFACEGLDGVTAKSGAVRIEMAYEDANGNTCQIESAGDSFQPPSFCPSGQSLCAGSCCSDGHCCTCNGVLGCWESCSGCD